MPDDPPGLTQATTQAMGLGAARTDVPWNPGHHGPAGEAQRKASVGKNAPAETRPVDYHGQAPKWLAKGKGGQRAGYRVVVGDIPAWTEREKFLSWLYEDPLLGSGMRDHLTDLTVHTSSRATSGMAQAFITVDSEDWAYKFYNAIWRWWAQCPVQFAGKGWRWFSLRFMQE